MSQYCHLHLHSHYSIADAISKIPDIVKRAKECGQNSCALTDHGNLYGSIDFYKQCNKQGIKPILGSEFYIVDDVNNKERGYKHLIVLAKNNDGWANIQKLTTIANKNYYFKPRIDYNILKAHSEGLIILSGCAGGLLKKIFIARNESTLQDYIDESKIQDAYKVAQLYQKTFGENFFLETQDSGSATIVKDASNVLREMGKKLGIPVVATQDSHYVNQNDSWNHEVLLAIAGKCKITDRPITEGGRRMKYISYEYWMKSRKDMEPLFPKEELDLSQKIADQCNVEIDFNTIRIPKNIDKDEDSMTILKVKLRESWDNKGISDKPNSKEYEDRILKELADVEFAKLADYFLVVGDMCQFAHANNIKLSPGRGSAAGSLICYLMGITGIDPVKYNLIWERFWNRGRGMELPDIDTDVPLTRRNEVIQYLKDKYGTDRVAHCITFNTLAIKAAIKDVCRAYDVSFTESNKITELVPFKSESIEDALNKSAQLQEYAEKHKVVFNIAKELEDTPKSRGTHASAIIISNEPIGDVLPMSWDSNNKELVTGFDGETLASLGFCKLDVLGLKTNDILADVEKQVNIMISAKK